jgi:hypothetical protein
MSAPGPQAQLNAAGGGQTNLSNNPSGALCPSWGRRRLDMELGNAYLVDTHTLFSSVTASITASLLSRP